MRIDDTSGNQYHRIVFVFYCLYTIGLNVTLCTTCCVNRRNDGAILPLVIDSFDPVHGQCVEGNADEKPDKPLQAQEASVKHVVDPMGSASSSVLVNSGPYGVLPVLLFHFKRALLYGPLPEKKF